MVLFSGAVNICYLFVDGECLNRIVTKVGERYFSNEKPPIDWRRMGESYRKIFYYDAIPVQRAGEDDTFYNARVAPKNSELSEIERQPSSLSDLNTARWFGLESAR
ncbi:MAG: hypothetical protein FJX48_02045 [Alphaproteobacteria bacterium]|nr:hypothetical protein [Alphaproteobacteria bacterium]